MGSFRTRTATLATQRQSEILRAVQLHGTCRIGDLATGFDVSGEAKQRIAARTADCAAFGRDATIARLPVSLTASVVTRF